MQAEEQGKYVFWKKGNFRKKKTNFIAPYNVLHSAGLANAVLVKWKSRGQKVSSANAFLLPINSASWFDQLVYKLANPSDVNFWAWMFLW